MERDSRGGAQPHVVPFARTPDVREGADSLWVLDDEHPSASESFDLAFDGEHEIEYWIWNGARLVPALPDEVERIQQREAQVLHSTPLTNERRSGAEARGVAATPRRNRLPDPMRALLVALLRPFRPDPTPARDALKRGA